MASRNSHSRGTRPHVTFRVTFSDKDMGFQALKKSVLALDGLSVNVGILAQQANLTYKDGTSLVTVAHKNEFGIGKTNPERSFMRKTFDESHEIWFRKIVGFMRKQVVGQILSSRVTDFTGKMMRDNVKRTVLIMKKPSNRPRTIAEKGFDDPLIHTKKLYNNIKYDVTKEDTK